MQWKWVLVCWRLLAAEVYVLLCFFLMPLSQVPVSRLANDLETATLHSINISLKSIMSPLNEIKAEHFKSCFSLVSANMSFILDADYFPPHCCLLSLSLSLSCSSHRPSERDLLNLLSWDWFQQFYELLKCPALPEGCKAALRNPPNPPPTNELINIAMETKWQEIAFRQTGASWVIISWCWFAAYSL